MPSVYWLEQAADSLPSENEWLSQPERRTIDGLRIPKRRADWRLGRWTAKQALSACLNLACDSSALRNIEIRPAPSGAPQAFLMGAPAPVTISLSHAKNRAVCAIAHGKVELGCDLEIVEARDEVLVRDYFTAEEQDWVQRAQPETRPALVTLVWSAKESALKALGTGLRVDTRSVIARLGNEVIEVLAQGHARDPIALTGPLSEIWKPLCVCASDRRDFHGWWMYDDDQVRTVVASPAPDLPTMLAASLLAKR